MSISQKAFKCLYGKPARGAKDVGRLVAWDTSMTAPGVGGDLERLICFVAVASTCYDQGQLV